MRPPAGLCLPCNFVRLRDADTVEVEIRDGGIVWPVRLLDCWAPERSCEAGLEAMEFAAELLGEAEDLHVWVPAPRSDNLLRSLLSFDRVLGHVYLNEKITLSDALVMSGHARKEKP